MLKPKKFANLAKRIGKAGEQSSRSSKAVSPKELVKHESEARRSGLDWATYTR